MANSFPSGISDKTPEKLPCQHFRFSFGFVHKRCKHFQKKIDFVYKEANTGAMVFFPNYLTVYRGKSQ
jgi:hypothetical protein